MNTCLFVTDLHGKMSRYEALLKIIKKEKPDFVFIGGDLLPHKNFQLSNEVQYPIDFVRDFLIKKFSKLKKTMDCDYPEIFIIPGNDDRKILFDATSEGEESGLWRNLHNRCVVIGKYHLYGYACLPPTPFRMKDWERLDVSKEIEPGCITPSDGFHSVPPDHDPQIATIQQELQDLIKDDDMEFGILLFHSPPFQTFLDQVVQPDGKFEEELSYLNVGSKAIRSLIDIRQPYITMHGHIHESARISGEWRQLLGRTLALSAAHDGPELALVKFELHEPLLATRSILKV